MISKMSVIKKEAIGCKVGYLKKINAQGAIIYRKLPGSLSDIDVNELWNLLADTERAFLSNIGFNVETQLLANI